MRNADVAVLARQTMCGTTALVWVGGIGDVVVRVCCIADVAVWAFQRVVLVASVWYSVHMCIVWYSVQIRLSLCGRVDVALRTW